MQSSFTWLDRLVGRLLFVQQIVPGTIVSEASMDRAENAFRYSIVFTGIQCILQYVVLPFILPALGLAAEWAVPLLVVVNLVAIVSLVYSVRRFWQINYRYKWQYLIAGVVGLLIFAVFMSVHLRNLTA